jgi:16S rRNA (adenine1518-N6/adenine1519-N6)-dimethyltransferase
MPSDFQTLAAIKAALAARGLHPKKRFGQNFLHDHQKLQRILDAAAVGAGDVVLEVGAGTGALTDQLLAAGAHVVAVEIDRDLAPILHERYANESRLTLVLDDVLSGKHELNPAVTSALDAARAAAGASAVKLVANLPYNVASPLLVNLFLHRPELTRAVVMVQREVADRLAAGPGGKDYGPLGILIQALATVERVTTLPPGCFWPQPGVDSAVILIARRDRPLTDQPDRLADLLHTLFSKRRKQLGSILGRDTPWPPGIDPQARPEQLTLDQLVALLKVTHPTSRDRQGASPG